MAVIGNNKMLNISAARRAHRKIIELNMAPLIDMVFILLIFFLVTTSFVKETGVDIARPVASTAVSRTGATVLIGITKNNAIYMNKKEIDVRSVTTEVERALMENPKANVVIVADRDSFTGLVINVMDKCKLAGAENISLAANLPR